MSILDMSRLDKSFERQDAISQPHNNNKKKFFEIFCEMQMNCIDTILWRVSVCTCHARRSRTVAPPWRTPTRNETASVCPSKRNASLVWKTKQITCEFIKYWCLHYKEYIFNLTWRECLLKEVCASRQFSSFRSACDNSSYSRVATVIEKVFVLKQFSNAPRLAKDKRCV